MPEVRQGNTRKRKQLRNTFRLSVILLFFIVSIIVSFIIHAMNFDISSKPIADMPETNSNDKSSVIVTDINGNSVTDTEGKVVTGEIPTGENSPVSGTSSNPVAQSQRKDDSYLDTCVFIGDSITTGLSGYKFVSPENVLASIGLRLDNVTTEKVKTPSLGDILVMDALEKIKPENVYILLGMNGVAWYDVANDNKKMIDEYSALVDSIKNELPQSNVYIISLTPVGTKKESIATAEEGRVLNTEVDRFNEKLLTLANEKEVHYIDMNSALKDENGKLADSDTTDGMHFVKDVYGKFVEYILTHTA
ncbi:MAG: hypothetical protein IJP18_09510 [Oscillospiraceae bacterium]|nr:hypothetical protein [Oscillospiraceae bacterium]